MHIVDHPQRTSAYETLRVNLIVGRARKQLSQAQLAKKAAVSRPTVSRIERGSGDVTIDVVQRIADALGVTVADLFTPPSVHLANDAEIAHRAADARTDFIDAYTLLEAIDETAAGTLRRYSRRGRPAVARPAASQSR